MTQPSPVPVVRPAPIADSVAETADCLNCGAQLAGAFCARCGQKVVDLEEPTWHVVVDALGEAIDFDGRVVRTGRAMLTPGELTREFLRGRRAPFLGPLKLFLLAGTALTTTWIVTRGIDARFYGMASDTSAAKYIDTVVRGAMASGIAIALGSWAVAGGRRRLLDEGVFALHLVAALALWAAAVIWLGTIWKLIWGNVSAVPRWVPSLPLLIFLPSMVMGLVYLGAAVHRVHGGRWWSVALRSAVIVAFGVAAVYAVIVYGA
jgi:hypothetical protein